LGISRSGECAALGRDAGGAGEALQHSHSLFPGSLAPLNAEHLLQLLELLDGCGGLASARIGAHESDMQVLARGASGNRFAPGGHRAGQVARLAQQAHERGRSRGVALLQFEGLRGDPFLGERFEQRTLVKLASLRELGDTLAPGAGFRLAQEAIEVGYVRLEPLFRDSQRVPFGKNMAGRVPPGRLQGVAQCRYGHPQRLAALVRIGLRPERVG
jgi:hypothetical protein